MTYRSEDFIDETNSRKRAMDALRKDHATTVPKSQDEEQEGDKPTLIGKLWTYLVKHKQSP